jgi:hypothetical protein
MATTIIVPLTTFTIFKEIPILGITIRMSEAKYNQIIYWVVSFGLLITGCAFFNYSSPKQSIRKGSFALLQVILNCMYLWSYKFSGATDIEYTFASGTVILIVEQLVLTYMGIYFMTVLIKGYDLIDFIVNRDKIRKNRIEKSLGEDVEE